jgi:hypothetical protein
MSEYKDSICCLSYIFNRSTSSKTNQEEKRKKKAPTQKKITKTNKRTVIESTWKMKKNSNKPLNTLLVNAQKIK